MLRFNICEEDMWDKICKFNKISVERKNNKDLYDILSIEKARLVIYVCKWNRYSMRKIKWIKEESKKWIKIEKKLNGMTI